MIVKLRPWPEVMEEYGFRGYNKNWFWAQCGNVEWRICKEMTLYFGGFIEVELIKTLSPSNYTHYGVRKKDGTNKCWYWHEKWFEDTDFINESEFMI